MLVPHMASGMERYASIPSVTKRSVPRRRACMCTRKLGVNFRLQVRAGFFAFRPLYEDIGQRQYISLRVVPTTSTRKGTFMQESDWVGLEQVHDVRGLDKPRFHGTYNPAVSDRSRSPVSWAMPWGAERRQYTLNNLASTRRRRVWRGFGFPCELREPTTMLCYKASNSLTIIEINFMVYSCMGTWDGHWHTCVFSLP